MTNSLEQEIFWTIHRDLPREAPGSDEATLFALDFVEPFDLIW